MPSYRFHFVPEDGKGDVELNFQSDDEALDQARRALREMVWFDDAPVPHAPLSIEVIREGGIVAGLVTTDGKRRISARSRARSWTHKL